MGGGDVGNEDNLRGEMAVIFEGEERVFVRDGGHYGECRCVKGVVRRSGSGSWETLG